MSNVHPNVHLESDELNRLGPEGSVHPGLKVMFAQGQKSPSVVSASDPEGNVQAKPKVRNLISLRAGEVRRALWSKSPRSPLTEWSEKLSSKSTQTKHLLKRI